MMSAVLRRTPETAHLRFIVTLTPEPGVDAIRALRAVLKTALRRHGLRAIDAREETEHTHVFVELRHDIVARRAARTPPHHEKKGTKNE